MAKFAIDGVDEMMAQLSRLGRFDELASKMLREAVPILEKEVVREASKHRDTGDMVRSIKPTGVIAGRAGGCYICVRPTGMSSEKRGRKAAVRNMEKMAWLEFGVKGRAATPILTTATLNAAPGVHRKLQEVFDREVRT